MNIECKTASYKDLKEIKKLWAKTFLDDETYIEKFLKQAVRFDDIFVAKDGDNLAGMLFLIPSNLILKNETIPAAYVYAVATKVSYRNKGVMRQLEEFACKKAFDMGIKAMVLVPQNKSLFDMYKKLSYETAFYKSVFKIACRAVDSNTLSECSKKDFFELRGNHLKTKECFFDFDRRIWDYRFEEFTSYGEIFLYQNKGKKGYIAGIHQDKSYLVKETDLKGEELANAVNELAKKYDTLDIKVVSEAGRNSPYGMIKMLDKTNFDVGVFPYMNFMLD